jgi:lysophospholipase L1-like esterase
MTESNRTVIETALAVLLVASSGIALSTCAATARPPGGSAPAQGPTTSPSEEAERAERVALTEPSSADPSTETAPAASGPGQPSGPLAPFLRELAAVTAGRRQAPVRILWLGDSHTAADYMTDAFRQVLADGYGPAGPGFVRVGVQHYRHARARFDTVGKWRRLPQQPSRRSTVLDGVFGLCGMRTVPEDGAAASVRLHATGLAPDAPVRFTLLYRLPAGSALRVHFRDRSEVLQPAETPRAEPPLGEVSQAPGSPIQRLVIEGRPTDELRLEHAAGSPEVYGLFAESTRPGLVVDTCGIDGARIATALAWDEEAWRAEVAARRPDLVVLAYGTNEAFDDAAPQRYAAEYERLLGRLRGAVPGLACWIVGPPDVWDRAGRATARVVEITDVQRRAAEELGCGFASARELMGGEGSFTAWRQAKPPLARADGVHLSSEGYETLGAALAKALVPERAERSR